MEFKSIAMTAVVLLFFLNGTPLLLAQSGVAEDMGIDMSVGGDVKIADANENMSNVQPSGGLAPTLYQLYTSVATTAKTAVDVLTAGKSMFVNLGMPEWLVNFIFMPLYLIIGGTMIYLVAGRRL